MNRSPFQMFQRYWHFLVSLEGQKTVSKKKSETKPKNHHPQMEFFPIETLMEEIKHTFTEKYVFDSREQSVDVATFRPSRLRTVWCKDQNQGFQNHKLLQKCGFFQPGAEERILWLWLQSEVILIRLMHRLSKHLWEVLNWQRIHADIKNTKSHLNSLLKVQLFQLRSDWKTRAFT